MKNETMWTARATTYVIRQSLASVNITETLNTNTHLHAVNNSTICPPQQTHVLGTHTHRDTHTQTSRTRQTHEQNYSH